MNNYFGDGSFDMDALGEDITGNLLPSRNESERTAAARKPLVGNHTGYQVRGSENWEHDDTGAASNFSGCYDLVLDPIAEHEGWQPGYDY
jgi:hypothetical protein